jgi:hypothetical protein
MKRKHCYSEQKSIFEQLIHYKNFVIMNEIAIIEKRH